MEMKKADLMKLCKRYPWLIVDSSDIDDVLSFVRELYELEADAIKESSPWAYRGIEECEAVARRISFDTGDIIDLFESEEA